MNDERTRSCLPVLRVLLELLDDEVEGSNPLLEFRRLVGDLRDRRLHLPAFPAQVRHLAPALKQLDDFLGHEIGQVLRSNPGKVNFYRRTQQ